MAGVWDDGCWERVHCTPGRWLGGFQGRAGGLERKKYRDLACLGRSVVFIGGRWRRLRLWGELCICICMLTTCGVVRSSGDRIGEGRRLFGLSWKARRTRSALSHSIMDYWHGMELCMGYVVGGCQQRREPLEPISTAIRGRLFQEQSELETMAIHTRCLPKWEEEATRIRNNGHRR